MKDKIGNVCSFRHKGLKCYSVWEPIFHTNWIFAYCPRWEDFGDMAKRCYFEDLKMPAGYVSGRCSTHSYENGNYVNFIWLKHFNYPQLAHEIIHGIVAVFDHKGVEISTHSDEYFAYYCEFIMAQLEKCKSWKPKVAKKGRGNVNKV